ncbi:hypothetical protein FIBSPDRAFT_934489 [Athelia psychrophila]|uniref:Rho-GAP domain-containing protein n=1 Tax=Athelia psychrophila TaxID=1759441 RepID=A0A166FFC0_9AGAM|nr:hypothetical protein FIBSPDRAFT_934489 [Fibularhizoctonia sp. CBS 109695]
MADNEAYLKPVHFQEMPSLDQHNTVRAPQMQWSPAIFMNLYKLLHTIVQDQHSPPRRILGCKDVLEWACIQKMHAWDSSLKGPQTVVGADVRRSIAFASTQILIGGQACNIPIIVHKCIEALQNTRQPHALLQNPPDETHCTGLITAFNSGPSYGLDLDLAHEPAANTFWLLVRYVEALPAALIHPVLVHPLDIWCVSPSRVRVQQHQVVKDHYAQRTDRDPTAAMAPDAWLQPRQCDVDPTDDSVTEEETKQVAIAALLLRLLPPSVFVLLVYLMDFLLELCTHPDYEITLEEIVDTFANKLVRGDDHALSEDIFMWLLTRWPEISGLLIKNSLADCKDTELDTGLTNANALADDDDAQPQRRHSQVSKELYQHAQGLHTRNAELARQKKHAHEALRAARTEEQVCTLGDLIKELGAEKDVLGALMIEIQSRLKAVEEDN